MISRASDYAYVKGADVDADHPHGDLDRIVLDGKIMPPREGDTGKLDGDGIPIPNKNIMRGEDISFLEESYLERWYLVHGMNSEYYPLDVYDIREFSRRVRFDQYHELALVHGYGGLGRATGFTIMDADIDLIDDFIYDRGTSNLSPDPYPLYPDIYEKFSPDFIDLIGLSHGRLITRDVIENAFENERRARRFFYRKRQSGDGRISLSVDFDTRQWDNPPTKVTYDEHGQVSSDPFPLTCNIAYYSLQIRHSRTFDPVGQPSNPIYVDDTEIINGRPFGSSQVRLAQIRYYPPGVTVIPVFKFTCRAVYSRIGRKSSDDSSPKEVLIEHWWSLYCHGNRSAAVAATSHGYVDLDTGTIHNAADRLANYAWRWMRSQPSYDNTPLAREPPYFPDKSQMYLEVGAGLPIFMFDCSLSREVTWELAGFICDLGDHTRWWSD